MKKLLISAILTAIVLGSHVFATPSTGGLGLIHLQSAKVLPQGFLEYYGGTKYYGKVNTGDAYTLWNVQFFSSFNYGVNSNLEFGLSPVIYQDTNTQEGNAMDGEANIIDDIIISMKIAGFSGLESPLFFGGILYSRIPTGEAHNIIYENYSAGTLEIGLTALASYYSNITFPAEGWSLHANLGYLNHNDVGAELTDDPDDITPNSMSSELITGVGLLYPAGTFDFSAEITARYFLTQPPVTAYSREYVSYLTTGVYYKPYRWLTVEFGMDMKLVAQDDQSEYVSSGTTSLLDPPEEFPNYPAWRGHLGVKIGILPTSLHASTEKSMMKQRTLQRQQVLRRMVDDQADTENAESELTRIKTERQRLEAELERLRRLIESEKDEN